MSEPAVDIRALAALARLDIADDEVAKLEKEVPGIVAFVQHIQGVSAELPKAASPAHRNVLRADDHPHESGEYTERLLAAAPAQEGGRIAVKQVISRKK